MKQVISDTPDILIERWDVPKKPRLSLLDKIYVEKGTVEDWNELHALHYKAEVLGFGLVFIAVCSKISSLASEL